MKIDAAEFLTNLFENPDQNPSATIDGSGPAHDRNPGPALSESAVQEITADSLPGHWRSLYKERAAIREYDGKQCREHAEAEALAEVAAAMALSTELPPTRDPIDFDGADHAAITASRRGPSAVDHRHPLIPEGWSQAGWCRHLRKLADGYETLKPARSKELRASAARIESWKNEGVNDDG